VLLRRRGQETRAERWEVAGGVQVNYPRTDTFAIAKAQPFALSTRHRERVAL
jgi:hypothetical protein